MKIKSLEFYDYKSFTKFTISAQNKNILVGPNNAGKSTSLDALRIAFDALRHSKRRTAFLKSQGAHSVCATYSIPQSIIQMDLRYCVHNFADKTARVELVAGNGNRFVMKLRPDADLECYLVSEVSPQKSTQFIKSQFPVEILVVPTLSPLEQNEELVKQETVEKNRWGRLASRNFRNFWLHRTAEEFQEFSDLVEYGWPGTRIMRPEIERGDKNIVRMYFRDGPNVREVQWAGFGFQVWMQIMMHLHQADHRSILVLDEPDIYLHPDLQHRLLKLVSRRVGQFFIATHSTEIINAADAGDVIIIRPEARSAKRIRSDSTYTDVYSAIGSSENAQFARLARTRKVLYFEGADNRILSKVSKTLGGIDYLSGSTVTIMRTDGFSNWGKVSQTAWVFKEFFELDVQVAALFDRDYKSDEEVQEFETSMEAAGTSCFVLPCKEIENILLEPKAIRRVVLKYSNAANIHESLHKIDKHLSELIQDARDLVFGQRVGTFIQYQLRKKPNSDAPTLSSQFQKKFTEDWQDESFRRRVVPGKSIFSSISKFVQDEFKVSLSPARVIDELDPAEIDRDIQNIISRLKAVFGGDE